MRPTNPSSTIMGIEHPKKRVLTPQEALRKKYPHPDLKTMTRAYKAFHLYPDDTRKPTQAEVNDAEKMVLDPKLFKLIDYGRLVLYEKQIPKKDAPPTEEPEPDKFIAYIEFTTSEELAEKDKDKLNLVTTYLHESKSYVSTVDSSRIFCGKMWTIGWRKSQTSGEMAGRYRNQNGVDADPHGFFYNTFKGQSAANVLYRLFSSIANTAVKAANTLLTSLKMPSYEDISWTQETSETNFASNLAFTSNEFSNKPHKDDDTSATAFLMLANTRIEDGSISTNNPSHSGFTGPFFVLPHHQVAINLRNLDGICRVVFAAGKFRHCTLNSQPPHKTLTSFGLSLQICKSCVDAFKRICNGYYNNRIPKKEGVVWHISDHNDIINKIPLPQ
ncbi:hypothetical protein KEM48_005071 [Puccinia striiformis f. sp. tritici PST-130]|nr:hypothetical protein KEM48_005071 [Puccinia striiformis f. sp. tritici PST-130]